MEKLLEVSDLHVAFPSKRETVRAVDGVSFQVFQGETFGLVGESGCGKSQTLRSILGLLKQPGRITGGEIRYKGADIAKMSQRELQKNPGQGDLHDLPGAHDRPQSGAAHPQPDVRGL